jgi:large subunit ribosomal protein L4
MSMIPVKNNRGEASGEFELADELLVQDKGRQAVYEAIVAYHANHRAGTASTLGKGAVAGAGSKPWKQKGTGRARSGYQQSPVWRGGSVAFGPQPRVFDRRLPRRVARLAFRRALSDKISEGALVVLEDLSFEQPKTQQMAALLRALGATRGALVVVGEMQSAVRLSARNLPNTLVNTAHHVNVYELLRYPLVVVTREGMEILKSRLEAAAVGRKA